ncbi:MAG TPA: GNAT family N-acetyltransferase [Ktedonobacterales bacterium]|nr:GNAT family N-acetyltransferase [Ktedonobacterales bacterium]
MDVRMRPVAGGADLKHITEMVYAHPTEALHLADLPYRLSSPSAFSADDTRIWEDASGRLLAYAVVQQPWGTLDYFIRPSARERGIEPTLMDWALGRFQALTDDRQRDLDWWIDTRPNLPDRISLAEQYGFAPNVWNLVHLEKVLQGPQPEPKVPAGFTLRPLAGESEAAAVAALQRVAFESENMTAEWRARTLGAPGYTPALDLVVAAPNGELAAFCLCWLEPDFRRGVIEPTGTHPKHQRHGLGRALLAETFRRMQALGAMSVGVESFAFNSSALAHYQSAGFRKTHQIAKYAKAFKARWRPT